jgi:hypothetical protein
MADAVQEAGWEVCVAARNNADPRRAISAGMKYIPLEDATGPWDIWAEIKTIVRLHILIR